MKCKITLLFLLVGLNLTAQVAINSDGSNPNGSAMLDVSSTNLGVLLPRMTTIGFESILNPAKGLMVYCTDDNNFFVNRGTPAIPEWTMVNSKWRANGPHIYFPGNNVGIGWPFPIAKLDVRGSNPDEPVNFLLGASDLSHRLLFSGGRTSDPNPFIQWKQGDSLRFGTDESGGIEVLRITNNGKVGIGITRPKWSLDIAGSINLPSDSSYRIGGTSVLCVKGIENTFVGWYTGISNSLGIQNTAIGSYALASNTDGFLNTACGHWALEDNTTGMHNTAIGVIALAANTTGYNNTACGLAALKYNTDGDYNTAVGMYADYSSNSDYNTSIGYNTGTTYLYSTSTFLGAYASPNADGYSNCMALGYDAKVTASNKVVIGNSNVTSIGGYAGWTNFSDGRYKKNISEDVPGLDFINQLRPVSYNLDVSSLNRDLDKNKPATLREGEFPKEETPDERDGIVAKERIVYTGFIAQEVEAIARSIGYDFSGVDAPNNENDYYGLRYAEFVVPLVKAVQEQQELITNYELRITNLELENKNLQSVISNQQTENNILQTELEKQETRLKKLEEMLGK